MVKNGAGPPAFEETQRAQPVGDERDEINRQQRTARFFRQNQRHRVAAQDEKRQRSPRRSIVETEGKKRDIARCEYNLPQQLRRNIKKCRREDRQRKDEFLVVANPFFDREVIPIFPFKFEEACDFTH